MDEETTRLMTAMGRRAKAIPGTCGHAIARWEAIHSRRAETVLGLDEAGMAAIRITPMPTRKEQIDGLAAEAGCDATALAGMLQEETTWPN